MAHVCSGLSASCVEKNEQHSLVFVLEHKVETTNFEKYVFTTASVSDRITPKEAFTQRTSIHERDAWCNAMFKLWDETKNKENHLKVVVATIKELKSPRAIIVMRASASDKGVRELLSRADVLRELVTSAGDRVRKERDSVACAFDYEFILIYFVIYYAVAASLASISEALDELHEEVPLASFHSIIPSIWPLKSSLKMFHSQFRLLQLFRVPVLVRVLHMLFLCV